MRREEALPVRPAADTLRGGLSTTSDSDLIARTLAGDTEAYGALVARYQDRIYWVAFQLLGHHEDAREVAQDAFLRAYRKLDTFDRSRRFYTWIYRIATNRAIDRMRLRSRAKPAPLSEEIEDRGPAPDDRLLGDELRGEVREVLDELPPRYRALLILRDVEGLSGKAISEATGVAHATVRWRIHRARKLFRDAWERRDARREGRVG